MVSKRYSDYINIKECKYKNQWYKIDQIQKKYIHFMHLFKFIFSFIKVLTLKRSQIYVTEGSDFIWGLVTLHCMFYGYETWMIFAHKQKHKRRSQFHKLLHLSFIARFLMVLVKIRAFNIEILLMLIDHRILWKGNTVKMAGGNIYWILQSKNVHQLQRTKKRTTKNVAINKQWWHCEE